LRHESVPHLGGVEKPFALVIADNQSVEWIVGSVATYDELLAPVDLVLDPRADVLD
jgi:hypothetical protein